ncbi:hypothetical protein CYMTET_48567 [Cymbomonas tetramitiformis]|uniref:Uncharacterized protein n=1 Tax=Cymbomonas tetramitiformis TaxID=36881 RepID=A0AAE0BS06_9CHLO|nr:hypothetical protein CYMTET_48567 [Cymbomonas tetramitiformis]
MAAAARMVAMGPHVLPLQSLFRCPEGLQMSSDALAFSGGHEKCCRCAYRPGNSCKDSSVRESCPSLQTVAWFHRLDSEVGSLISFSSSFRPPTANALRESALELAVAQRVTIDALKMYPSGRGIFHVGVMLRGTWMTDWMEKDWLWEKARRLGPSVADASCNEVGANSRCFRR